MTWLTNPAAKSVRGVARRALLSTFVKRRTRLRIEGLDHLRNLRGQFVMVANHSSDLDTAVIYHALPRRLSRHLVTGAAADRFFENKRNALLPSLLFSIYPIDRPGRGRDNAHRGLSGALLDRGLSLLIFPQGTRWGGRSRRFSSGPARLASQRGLPICPVSIVGAAEAWAPGAKRPVRGRPLVIVRFGKPIIPRTGEPANVLTERVQRAIARGGEAPPRASNRPHGLRSPGQPPRRR